MKPNPPPPDRDSAPPRFKMPIRAPADDVPTPGPLPACAPEKISPRSDALDDSSPTPATHSVPALLNEVLVNKVESADDILAKKIGQLVIDPYKNVYAVMSGGGNPFLLKLGSSELNGTISQVFRQSGHRLTRKQLGDITDELQAEAETSGLRADVWRRIAPHPDGGIVIALHDEKNTHIHISPGKVEVLTEGSEILFYRSPSSSAMVMPAPVGDCMLLRKYLNLHAVPFTLYIAYVTYTLAHAKVNGSNFLILVFIGGEGTGKSHATKVTIMLVDPNFVGVERMPSNAKDLAIGLQNSHLVAFDNLRHITTAMSDALCTATTGGALTTRKMYTDDDQKVLPLHGAVVLNGIYSLTEQPDLAQRCLPLRLEPMLESQRIPTAEMRKAMEADLPAIQRGLFDLIAQIFLHLPAAEITNPQRMIEFVRWLAAMEIVYGAPQGTFQGVYAEALNEGQLDGLMDNTLGSAVMEFADTLDQSGWSGTPAQLLEKLTVLKAYGLQRPPRDWPDNEIALSKRLVPLQAALMTQDISVQFKRGKNRNITITKITQESQDV